MEKTVHVTEAGAIAPLPRPGKWEQEYQTFLRLRRSLLRTHRNEFVAVHGGKVVDSENDKVVVGLRVYAKFGYVPIYDGRVSTKPARGVRLPSPRRIHNNGGNVGRGTAPAAVRHHFPWSVSVAPLRRCGRS